MKKMEQMTASEFFAFLKLVGCDAYAACGETTSIKIETVPSSICATVARVVHIAETSPWMGAEDKNFIVNAFMDARMEIAGNCAAIYFQEMK